MNDDGRQRFWFTLGHHFGQALLPLLFAWLLFQSCGALFAQDAPMVAAEAQPPDPLLWTECSPMRLVVQDLSNDARDVALTSTILEAAAASRLRAARLLVDEPGYGLWIRFDLLDISVGDRRREVVGVAFNLGVQFIQPLWYPASETWFGATTWQHSMLGATSERGVGARQFVLGALDQLLDRFISEYLHANEAACGGPGDVR